MNYASSREAGFIGDLPWSFDSLVFGDVLLVDLQKGLFARVSIVDGGVDDRDKTSREIAGFQVEVVHRSNGPIITQVFRFRDFVDESSAEGSFKIKRVKGKFLWVNEKGEKKVQDSFYSPICTAIGGFLSFVSADSAPLASSKAEEPTPQNRSPSRSDTSSSQSSAGLVAVIDL